MTPDQITTISAIAAIIDKIGTWPIGTMLFIVVLGPWVLSLFLSRATEKRFDAMRQMYENNVELVKNYERTTSNIEKITRELVEIVSLNTAQWVSVAQKIDTNQFCPAHRTTKIKMEAVG